jgi:hypothetical protein
MNQPARISLRFLVGGKPWASAQRLILESNREKALEIRA